MTTLLSLSVELVNLIPATWTLAIIHCGRRSCRDSKYKDVLKLKHNKSVEELHTMGEERDMFEGLGWDEEVVSLEKPHIPFTPSPAWIWGAQEEERLLHVDKSKTEDVVDSQEVEDESNTVDEEEEVKEAVEESKQITVKEMFRNLSPHRLPYRERIKDRSISYVDLLCPDPPSPPKSDAEYTARASRS